MKEIKSTDKREIHVCGGLTLGVYEFVESQNFSIINHNYLSPVMIVTRMYATFIIG